MSPLFKLDVAWTSDGDSPFHLIGQAAGASFHEQLFRTTPAVGVWVPPVLPLAEERDIADVYLSIWGYFVFMPDARRRLSALVDDWVEWLPARAEKLGPCFILNPLHYRYLAAHAEARQNEVSRNIAVVYRYAFDTVSEAMPPLFGIAHPSDSAAGRAGCGLNQILDREAVGSIQLRGIQWKKVTE